MVETQLYEDSHVEIMASKVRESQQPMDVEELTPDDDSDSDDDDDDDAIGSSQEEESTDEDSLEEEESSMNVRSNPADFLLKPPIAENELHAISPIFHKRIAAPLELFRKDGFAAYQAFLLKQKEDLEAQARLEESRKQESLQYAAILGNPRDYQLALFEVAKRRNTVINLGTGKGKTLIALLVIRHFAGAFDEGKQALFLVPSVALAVQQTTTLQANLPYKVATACRTTTNAEPARQRLAEANIIVATHGAMHDLLMHYEDVFQMKRFCLLILDECHYATRNHVYASIMGKWYHPLPITERPHVLGLTASPLLNVKYTHSDEQLETMLAQLERRLDSQVVCLKDLEIDQETNLLHKPAEEKHILYRDMQHMPPLPSCEDVGLHKSRHREFHQLDGLYTELGPLAVSIYCRTLAREVSRNDFEKETMDEFRCVVQHLLRIADYCDEQFKSCPWNGRSDKLLALEEQLEQLIEHHGSAETVGIVFVERRITALALHDFFRARQAGIDEGTWIRASRVGRAQRQSRNERYFSATMSMIENTPIHDSDEVSGQFEDCDTDAARDYLIRRSDPPTDAYVKPISVATHDRVETVSGQFDDADESECGNFVPSTVVQQEMQVAPEVEAELEGSSIVTGQFSHAEDDDMDFDVFFNPVESRDDDTDVSHIGGSIRSGVMVRRATHVFKYLTGSNRANNGGENNDDGTWLHKEHKIREVMRQLRKHEINVLFATSIVEEGVDVQACSFVIVFDSLKSAKGYIQMKGRARQTNATFVVLQNEKEMKKGKLSLDTAQRLERRVHDFIEQRDTLDPKEQLDVTRPGSFLKCDGSTAENELRAIQAGIYTAKHGSVDLVSAKGLLNKYAMAIPLDPSSRTTRESFMMHMPVYENYHLMLPSHLPAEVRMVRLPEAYHAASITERHQMLALMACVRLHGLRLLSDRLLPLTRNDLHDELLRVAKKEISLLSTYCSQINVLFQSGKREVYLYPIVQTGDRFQDNQRVLKGQNRGLALISIKRIPRDIPAMVYPHGQLGEISCSLGLEQTKRLSLEEWEECALFYATLFNGRWRRRTRNVHFKPVNRSDTQGIIPPYIIGCLSSQGTLDWTHMRQIISEGARTDEELRKAASTFTGREAPRMWAPLYDPNVPYIVYGPSNLDCSAPFPDDIEGVETFQDYFAIQRDYKVPKETRLFVVQRLWYLQSEALSTRKLRISREVERDKEHTKVRVVEQTPPKHDYEVCAELGTVLLPIDACTEIEVADTYMALLCAVLPQFLYHIDCNLIADAFRRHCAANLPHLGRYLDQVPRNSIVEALSAKSARLEQSYDRLEWLGDAVLKILQTDALLQTPELRHWVQCLHEGDLTKLRSEMGCNERLADSCGRLGLDKFILSVPLERGTWTPVQLKLCTVDQEQPVEPALAPASPGMKVCADAIEALIGLVYLTSGFEATVEVARELGISLPTDGSETVKGGNPNLVRSALLDVVKTVIGKDSFESPQLVEEAFTHPSAVYQDVSSYQRLEWVGDAVLCLAMREWIYNAHPLIEVGDLVNMESALVSNETLAYLCFQNGLHTFINHRDQGLPSRLEHYEWCVKELGRGLWGTDPPKVLADVVESLLGAAHIDGGFQEGKQAALAILKPITTLLQTADNANCTSRLNNPKTVMHTFAGDCLCVTVSKEEDFAGKNATELVWHGDRWRHADEEAVDYVATISCLGINVLSIVETTRKSARNRACAMAVALIEDDPSLLAELQVVRGTIDLKKSHNPGSDNDEEGDGLEY